MENKKSTLDNCLVPGEQRLAWEEAGALSGLGKWCHGSSQDFEEMVGPSVFTSCFKKEPAVGYWGK